MKTEVTSKNKVEKYLIARSKFISQYFYALDCSSVCPITSMFNGSMPPIYVVQKFIVTDLLRPPDWNMHKEYIKASKIQ